MVAIRKKFVRFSPHVYEENRFLKNCNESQEKYCDKCRVILMRDRFLGEEFHELAGLKGNVNPYILLVDSAGCNMRCWFCYAHQLLKSENYNDLDPVFKSASELADCFACKMKMAKRLRKKDQDRYFSRIRITGGEPLFSTDDTITGRNKLSAIEATIDYYIEFFKRMDKKVSQLLQEGVIDLVTIQPYKKSMEFPTWLATRPNRVNIRFDTNGLLFTKRDNAFKFIKGIGESKLKHLRIEIDYSIKAPTPIEMEWVMRKSLPVDIKKIKNFNIKNHPQYSGLMNIIDIKERYRQLLGDTFSLTIERGINHGKTNGYINFPNSLRWQDFTEKFNSELQKKNLPTIKFSDVNNPLQYAKQFGYLFGRYHSHGAAVRVESPGSTKEYMPWDTTDKEKILKKHIKKIKEEGKPFNLIFYPCKQATSYSVEAHSSVIAQKEDKIGKSKIGNVWIFTGKLLNWEFSIQKGIWGVKEKHKDLWNSLKQGNQAVFYVSKPVGGLIGVGIVTKKFNNEELVWEDEIDKNECIYPYKINFKIKFVLQRNKWVTKRIVIKRTGIPFQHGINLVDNQVDQNQLNRLLKRFWDYSIF